MIRRTPQSITPHAFELIPRRDAYWPDTDKILVVIRKAI
jgi:hypothetical protein